VLSLKTRAAPVARHAWVYHHPVAGGDRRHPRSDRLDNARTVGAEHVREVETQARQTLKSPQIEMIQRSGLEAHLHVSMLCRFRIRNLAHLQTRQVAM
jgi:hypothetical protein